MQTTTNRAERRPYIGQRRPHDGPHAWALSATLPGAQAQHCTKCDATRTVRLASPARELFAYDWIGWPRVK